jgi:K+-transporting ATPase ATPase C chain
MKSIYKELATALLTTAAFAIILCGLYPITVFALAQGLFPFKANGSVIRHNGIDVGSDLLGQQFTNAGYFHSRPSAAGNGYDAMASAGSNLGPTSKDLIIKTQERIQEYMKENSLPDNTQIPADAVMASASGLDPHISPQNALLQAGRVAKARRLNVDTVKEEIVKLVEGRTFGLLGEPRVNVFKLNLALDQKFNATR